MQNKSLFHFFTKQVWPEDQYPPFEVGRLVLNRNPDNYFAQVEQLAFSPANRVPGLEFSPDKVLQARLFAYSDTARHRIGPNFHLVPVNQPLVPVLAPTFRDGAMMTGDNQGPMPNYYPCSFNPAVHDNPQQFNELRTHIESTDVDRFVSDYEDNYTQVRDLYLSYTPAERNALHNNIVSELQYTTKFIQERALEQFGKIHADYAAGVKQALQAATQQSAGN